MAFFTVAFAASAPNLFVGIISAFHGIPELSFGDIIGGNVIDLTLAVALAIFLGQSSLSTDSRLIQNSAIFTAAMAVLPLFLILDGDLSRGDGLVLIGAFFFYIYWLFSKGDRFNKIYDDSDHIGFGIFLKDLGRIVFALGMILLASGGIVKTAVFFSGALNLPMIYVGILIVALGNALPETYFAVVSAKREQNWMVLGDLMGSVISSATLVLGIVALIKPIIIQDVPTIAVARVFMIMAALFFLIFTWTGKRISRREAVFLFALYALFVIVELWIM